MKSDADVKQEMGGTSVEQRDARTEPAGWEERRGGRMDTTLWRPKVDQTQQEERLLLPARGI